MSVSGVPGSAKTFLSACVMLKINVWLMASKSGYVQRTQTFLFYTTGILIL